MAGAAADGTPSSAVTAAFFAAAAPTPLVLSEAELTDVVTAMNLSPSDLGGSDEGYKLVGLRLPSTITLEKGMKFFVMLTDGSSGDGKRALGMGVISGKQAQLKFLPIVFKLLKNPADTSRYMTFDAGSYYIGATNDMASGDTGSAASMRARVVFVTAAGDTFTIASDTAALLQGQTASGDAVPYVDASGDDDEQETSSHGSSSGCPQYPQVNIFFN